MPFSLNEIKPLFLDMKNHDKKQDGFSFQYNKVRFDVVFLMDRTPFELLFGVLDHNFTFVLKMYQGFKLEAIPDEVFYKLCEILNLKPGKGSFTSWDFLKYFASKIPQHYSGKEILPHEIALYKRNKIEEKNKIYFKGWIRHNTDGKHARNLEKTKELLGEEAYLICRKYNISSCWSDQKEDYTRCSLPDISTL